MPRISRTTAIPIVLRILCDAVTVSGSAKLGQAAVSRGVREDNGADNLRLCRPGCNVRSILRRQNGGTNTLFLRFLYEVVSDIFA